MPCAFGAVAMVEQAESVARATTAAKNVPEVLMRALMIHSS